MKTKLLPRWHNACKKYLAIAKISFINKFAYPIDILTEICFVGFIFSILFFLHRVTKSITPTSPVEQLSLAQTMWIIFITTIFAGERGKSVMHALNDEILSGQIAYQLNRPYSYVLFYFAQHIGSKLSSIMVVGTLTGLYIYFLVGLPSVDMISCIIGFYMLCIGIIISFLLQFCVGICSFWIGNTDPLRWIYLQVMIVCGGMAVPLALFPATLKNIILCLPFANVLYGAARVLVGCPTTDTSFYISMQLLWLVAMMLIARFLFNRRVKNVVICGG